MEEFKHDFAEGLQDLTFNSRPIIQALTEIAAENVAYAPAVVDAIEAHILACPPPSKLPAMYLLDSICKNLPAPYAALFTPTVFKLYTETFVAVQEAVRIKLGELFTTWTAPQANGQPLFPHEVLRKIDNFLAQAHNLMTRDHGPSSRMPSAGPAAQASRLTQTGLLVEINRLTSQLQGFSDQESENITNTLQRFQAQLSGPPLDQPTLQDMQRQIDSFGKRAKYNRGGARARERDRDRDRRRGNRGRKEDAGTGANSTKLGQRKKPLDGIDLTKLAESIARTKAAAKSPGTDKPSLSAAVPVEQLPSLLSSLKTAGLLNNGVQLTSASLDIARPALIAQLYSDMPLCCPTCARRFKDDEEGRAAKQAEMDWHFRVNQSLSQDKSHSRCWFLTTEQWIAYRDEDEVLGVAAENANMTPQIDMNEVAKQCVPVPPDPPAVAQCPVCREKFVAVWNENVEEWVYANATKVNGHLINATCYADPQNKAIVDSIVN